MNDEEPRLARLQRLLFEARLSAWHSGGTAGHEPVHEALGLTREEYARWRKTCQLPADWPREE